MHCTIKLKSILGGFAALGLCVCGALMLSACGLRGPLQLGPPANATPAPYQGGMAATPLRPVNNNTAFKDGNAAVLNGADGRRVLVPQTPTSEKY